MKRVLLIFLLFGITVQAQFTPLIGIVATQENLGPETVDDPSFDNALVWENANGYFTVTGGQAVHDGTGLDYIRQDYPTYGSVYDSGKTYKVVIDVDSNSGTGTNPVYFGDSGEVVSNTHLDAGIHIFYHTMSQTKANIVIYGRSNAPIVLNSVSVKEVL